MLWREWEPTYRAILADFGYDAKADDEARDLLSELARGKARVDFDLLRGAIGGRVVVIAGPVASGGGTEVPKDAEEPKFSLFGTSVASALRSPRAERPLIATDASTWAFKDALAIVTDLDGDVAAQVDANARGVPLFVHAHGDNRDAIARWVPRMSGPVQPTTQASPREGVENFGGFTDGDRACCLAVHLGARSLVLAGFDFDEPWPKPRADPSLKRRKLAWARRIIDGLGVPVTMV